MSSVILEGLGFKQFITHSLSLCRSLQQADYRLCKKKKKNNAKNDSIGHSRTNQVQLLPPYMGTYNVHKYKL